MTNDMREPAGSLIALHLTYLTDSMSKVNFLYMVSKLVLCGPGKHRLLLGFQQLGLLEIEA